MEARTKGHLAAAASDDGGGGGGAAPQYSQEEIVGELREMERTVASIASLAVVSAGSSAARMLEDELLGRDGSRSLLAGLDRLVEEIEAGRLERRKVDGGTQEETAPGLYDNDSTAYDVADGDRYDTTEGTEPFLETRTVKNGNREWNAAGAPIVDFPPSGAEVVIDGYDDIYDDGEDAATTSVFVPDVIASDNNENTSGGRRSGPRRTTTLIDADVEFIVSGLDAYVTVTPDEEALRETGAGAGAGAGSGSVYATPDVELVLDDDDDALLMQNAKSLDVASIAVEEEELEEEENLVATMTLRAVDVVLFVGEKALTSGIPSLVNGCTNIITRTEEINREGKGKEGKICLIIHDYIIFFLPSSSFLICHTYLGWDTLKHLNKGNKRY